MLGVKGNAKVISQYSPVTFLQPTASGLVAECGRQLHPNHKSFVILRDAYAACLSVQGKVSKAIEMTESNLVSLRLRHGEHSVSVAREVDKLADLYELDAMPEKALKVRQEAQRVFVVHYGRQYLTHRNV